MAFTFLLTLLGVHNTARTKDTDADTIVRKSNLRRYQGTV